MTERRRKGRRKERKPSLGGRKMREKNRQPIAQGNK